MDIHPTTRDDHMSPIATFDLNEVVTERLREMIATGALSPGRWIRPGDVAPQLGVSATPVREALRRLQAEGLVEFIPRRGARVLEMTATGYREVLHIRKQLESLACIWISEDFSRVPLRRLRELLIRLEEAEQRRDIPRRMELVQEYLFAIYSASGKPTLIRMLRMIYRVTAPYRLLFSRMERTVPKRLEYFRAMLEACEACDQAQLQSAMHGLTDYAEQSLIPILLERESAQVAPGSGQR